MRELCKVAFDLNWLQWPENNIKSTGEQNVLESVDIRTTNQCKLNASELLYCNQCPMKTLRDVKSHL